MRVSLILATVNRDNELKKFLKSLINQTNNNYRLIIVDQNQDNKIDKIIEEYKNKIEHVVYIKQKDLGSSKARNKGLEFVDDSDIAIGFPDDDCVYEPNLIDKIIRKFSENDDYDGVTINHKEKELKLKEQLHKISDWDNFKMISTNTITMFFRPSLLKKVGSFDERIGPSNWFGGGEETDLMYRCVKTGAKIVYNPDIFVSHQLKSITSYCNRENLINDKRRRERGTGAIWKKHRFSKYVIVRGLISPLLKIFINIYSISKIKCLWNVFLGRLEGYCGWRYK